jgi:predicted Zn-dependent peptidase
MSNDFEIYKLKNGLTVILLPLVKNIVNDIKCIKNNKFVENIGFNLLIPVGSRHESDKTSGTSHCLEHQVFRQKIDKNISVMRKLQMNGCIFNAETGIEYTHYYIIGNSKHYVDNIKIMANILLDLDFNDEEIEKEKKVVMEEYFMCKDNVKKVLIQTIFSLLSDKKHPINRPVIGSLKNIKEITATDLINFKKEHYNTNTSILVISGMYDKEKLLKTIELNFNEKRIGKLNFPYPLVLKKDGLKVKTIFKPTFNHTYFCLSFKSINLYDNDRYKYDVLAQILKTRLFLALRETNGLTYNSNVVSSCNSDFGLFGILTSVISIYIYKTILVILNELYKLKTELIKEDELNSAIMSIINENNVEFSSILNHNVFYGFQYLYKINNIITPGKYLEKISVIKAKDILAIAKSMFKVDNMILVSIGNLSNNNNLKKTLNLLKN